MVRLLITLLLVAGISYAQAQTSVTIKKTYREIEEPKERIIYVDRQSDKKCDRKDRRKDRLHFQVGVAGNYLYDSGNETGFDPVPDRTNGMGEAMLGIRFDQKGRRANVLGVWATSGFSSPQSVELLLQEQRFLADVDLATPSFRFTELEAGFLFREWFRLSGGVGTQEFVTAAGEEFELDYYKVTTGLSIRLTKAIKWNTNATFITTDGMDQFTFRPSTGLSFRFNFLKI